MPGQLLQLPDYLPAGNYLDPIYVLLGWLWFVGAITWVL